MKNKTVKEIKAIFSKACDEAISLVTENKPKIFNYTDIDTFEDALDMVEDSQTKLGDTLIGEFNKIKSIFPEENHFYRKAQAHIIVFAANGCDEAFPNNNDDNQRKYYVWFYRNKSGVGFSFYAALFDLSCTSVGSRLEFKEDNVCKHIVTKFLHIWKGMLIA